MAFYMATFTKSNTVEEFDTHFDALKWVRNQIQNHQPEHMDNRIEAMLKEGYEQRFVITSESGHLLGTVDPVRYKFSVKNALDQIHTLLLASLVYEDHMDDIEQLFYLGEKLNDHILPLLSIQPALLIHRWFIQEEYLPVAENLVQSITNHFGAEEAEEFSTFVNGLKEYWNVNVNGNR